MASESEAIRELLRRVAELERRVRELEKAREEGEA